MPFARTNLVFAVIALILLCGSPFAVADPNQSLMTTYMQNEEHQIGVEIGSQKPAGQSSSSALTLGYGYRVTDSWFSELYGSYVRNSGESTQFDSAAWLNTFMLTQDQSPLEIGLYTEIEYEQDHTAGYKATIGPLVQAELGLTTVNLNLLLHRNYLADFSNTMQLDYQWQVKRRWNEAFEFGIQGFGELGTWNNWSPHNQQAHRIGPVVIGKFDLGEQRALHYNAAVLFDVFDGQSATTFRLQAIYGF